VDEKEKMLAGEWYDANYDSALTKERIKAKDLCFDLNHTKPSDTDERHKILSSLFSNEFSNIEILSPFMVDYGYNITLGDNVFINHDCYLMDCAPISIGDNTFIGPKCGLYTANHPLNAIARNKGVEQALPITIGNNVWLGANVIILPGVTIGNGVVVSAGSIVTKNISDNQLVMGAPAKVVKAINNSEN
jgi:acetyltransferase-like isoleucine patch superfamily enzyme